MSTPDAPAASVPNLLRLRPATLEDVPALLHMTVDFNRIESIPIEPTRLERALRALLESTEVGLVRMSLRGDDVIGYSLVSFGYDLEYDGRDAFITEFYLKPEWRGKGLAKELLEALCHDAVTAGVNAIHLQVRPENAPARALYTSAGFEVVPRLVMSRKLKKAQPEHLPSPVLEPATLQEVEQGYFSRPQQEPRGASLDELARLRRSPVALARALGIPWSSHPANPSGGRMLIQDPEGTVLLLVAPDLDAQGLSASALVYSAAPEELAAEALCALLDASEGSLKDLDLYMPLALPSSPVCALWHQAPGADAVLKARCMSRAFAEWQCERWAASQEEPGHRFEVRLL